MSFSKFAQQAAERRRETFDHDDDPLNEELNPDNDKPSFDKPPPPPPVPEEPVSSEFTSSPSETTLEDPFVESPVFPNLATKGNPITDFSVDFVGQEAGESQGSGKGKSPAPPVATLTPPAPMPLEFEGRQDSDTHVSEHSREADSERTASPEIDPNKDFLSLVGSPPALPPRWVEAAQSFFGSLPKSLPRIWGSGGSRPSTPDSESPPTPPRKPTETDPLLGNKQEPRRPLNEAEERERLLAEFAQHIGSYSDYLARFEDSISETSVAYVPGQGWTDSEGLLTWQTKGQWPPMPLPPPGGRRRSRGKTCLCWCLLPTIVGLLVITALVIFAMLSGKTLSGLPKLSRLEFPVWQASTPQVTTYASLPLPELNVTSSASFSQTVSQPPPAPEPTPTSSSSSDDPSSSFSSSSSSQTVSQSPPQTTEAPSSPSDDEASSGEPTERHTTTKWRQMYYVYVPDREVTTV